MIMTSGIMNTTQSENINSPKNNLESPSTSMQRVQQRRSRVPIYINFEGDDVDLGEDDDGDGDVAVDDEDGTSPDAKGVSTATSEQQDQPSAEEKRNIDLHPGADLDSNGPGVTIQVTQNIILILEVSHTKTD
jgi:hypothetical protein